MSARDLDGSGRVLRLIARKLEDYLEGDDLALETLAEALEQVGATADDVHAAALAIRGLAGANGMAAWVGPLAAGDAGRPAEAGAPLADATPATGAAAPADAPGRGAQRVLSAEERGTLTTEAWGYLIDLRSRGALDADQFERVLETLTSLDERPVAVERAHEVAARVALESDGDPGWGEYPHGDQEVAH